jgi:hypothetical protein
VNQGKTTKGTLDLLRIPTLEMSGTCEGTPAFRAPVAELVDATRTRSCPVALLFSKDTFAPYDYSS